MDSKSVGFIGCGNIASAILGGMIGSGYITSDCVRVFDVDAAKADALHTTYGVGVCSRAEDVVAACKYVFLTIKPQVYDVVLGQIKSVVRPDNCLVDVAAGVSIDFVKRSIGFDCKVVRVMPNTPLLTGHGASALVKLPPVTDAEFNFVRGAFEASGVARVVDEDAIDAVIGASGSSPAFVFRFAKNIIEASTAAGLDADTATALVAQTLIGSAHMILESGLSIDELIRMVSSPNGTTVAGLAQMDATGFDDSVCAAVQAAVARSKELRK